MVEYAAKTASEREGVVRAEDGVGVAWLDWVGDLDLLEGDKFVCVEVVTPSNHLELPAEQSAMVAGESGEENVEKLVRDDGGGGIQEVGETRADEMVYHSACASFLNAKCLEQHADLDEGYEMDVTAFA